MMWIVPQIYSKLRTCWVVKHRYTKVRARTLIPGRTSMPGKDPQYARGVEMRPELDRHFQSNIKGLHIIGAAVRCRRLAVGGEPTPSHLLGIHWPTNETAAAMIPRIRQEARRSVRVPLPTCPAVPYRVGWTD